MYNRDYDLSDINSMRLELIYDALKALTNNVQRGVPYTAKQLSALTGGRIRTSTFEACLARGYHAIEKRKNEGREKTPYYKDKEKYWLFGCWNAECSIRREGVEVITVKEFNEQGELIREYQRRRGRPYYTATF